MFSYGFIKKYVNFQRFRFIMRIIAYFFNYNSRDIFEAYDKCCLIDYHCVTVLPYISKFINAWLSYILLQNYFLFPESHVVALYLLVILNWIIKTLNEDIVKVLSRFYIFGTEVIFWIPNCQIMMIKMWFRLW